MDHSLPSMPEFRASSGDRTGDLLLAMIAAGALWLVLTPVAVLCSGVALVPLGVPDKPAMLIGLLPPVALLWRLRTHFVVAAAGRMQLAPAGIIFRVGPVAATVPYARIAMIRLVSEPVFTAGGESEPDDVAPPGPSVAISGRGVRRVFRPEGDAAACAAAVHARCPNAVHIALDGTETAPQAGWSRESLASRVATLRRAAIGQSVVGGFLLVLAAASLIKRHAVGEALMFGGLGVGLLLSALRDVRRSRTPPGPPSARTAGSG